MMRVLVSARSVDEAFIAAQGGADFVDLKEPGQGALGGLPVAGIRQIVSTLRDKRVTLPVSATIGDWPMAALDRILAQVEAVGACGVDYVKVGIERGPLAHDVLCALAASGRPVIPVLIADHGLDDALVDHAVAAGFAGLMLDTADKRRGSLLDMLPLSTLQRFVSQAREAGVMAGLAGALRLDQADILARLAPDFAGFRSAVCGGERHGAIAAMRVRALVGAVQKAQAALLRTSPSSSERMRASSSR
jgi:(5-formylfuran-3-yl)methyl phosphate synthase